jgi:hypothetical protein
MHLYFVLIAALFSISEDPKTDVAKNSLKGSPKIVDVVASFVGVDSSGQHFIKRVDYYNEQGNIVKHEDADENGKVGYSVYLYNSNGTLAKEQHTSAVNGRNTFNFTYQYKAGSKLPTAMDITGDMAVVFKKLVLVHDGDGNLTKQTAYGAKDETLAITQYKYVAGKKVEEWTQSYSDYFESGKSISQYNDKGVQTGLDQYAADGKLMNNWKYIYKGYDKEGNWLEKEEWNNGKLNTIERRTIIYH